jgi:hypothetical protein
MNGPDEKRPAYDRGGAYPSRPGTLVFACLAIGLLASAVQVQRLRIHNEQQRATVMATTADLYAGKSQELGQLMADSHTQLIRLSSAENSPVRGASMAWNAGRRRGALFCDQLPIQNAGQSYEIWAVDAGGSASQMADVKAEPGVSVYPFRSAVGTANANRFEVTDGPRLPGQGPILSGAVAGESN